MLRFARAPLIRWLVLPLAFGLIGGTAAFIHSQPKREVTTRSEEAYQAYQAGMKSLREVHSAEALRWFRKAVDIDSTFAMAWMRLGRTQFTFGKVADARLSYAKAVARFDRLKPREQYFIRMLETDLNWDEGKRAALMEEMVARFPNDSEVLMYYALRAFFAREHQKALDAYRKLLLQDPTVGDAYNMIGYTCCELGRWDEAVEAFQKYAFLFPEQSNPHDSLGELYLRTGRYADAVKACDKATAITPDFVWARVHAACALSDQGRFDEALTRLRAGLRAVKPDDPEIWNLRNQVINVHLLALQPDSAAGLARAGLAEDPTDAAPPFFLCRLHASRGEVALARRYYEAYLKADGSARRAERRHSSEEKNFMIHELRGALAAAEGKWDEAAEHFDRGTGKTENWWINRRVQLERLESLVRAGRLPQAAAFADTLSRVNPHEPRLLGILARIEDARGRGQEARRLRAEAGAWSDSRLLLAAH